MRITEFAKIAKPVAAFASGIALTSIALEELFQNQAGTAAQVALVAIPLFSVLFYGLPPLCDLKEKRFEILTHLPTAFLLSVFAVFLIHAIQLRNPAALCDFYSTCNNSQPRFVEGCKLIQNHCHQKLEEAHWHYKGPLHSNDGVTWHVPHSFGSNEKTIGWSADGFYHNYRFDEKIDAVHRLCTRLFSPEKNSCGGFYADYCFRPPKESLELILTLRDELFEYTGCNPHIEQNHYYRIVSPITMSLDTVEKILFIAPAVLIAVGVLLAQEHLQRI